MREAITRSRLSNRESVVTFRLLEASHSSLMLEFLLDLSRCLLVSFIFSAICAKVEMPSPQKLTGALAHSVTQELGGNSSQSLMYLVHKRSTTPERKASVKL